MSDKWKVDYFDKALLDLQILHDHIAFTLLEPVVAARQSDRIMYSGRDVDAQLNAGG